MKKIYIVEDKAITRATLDDVLTTSGYHVIGSSPKAEKAWKEITTKEVDLVILDVNLLGEKDGVWLAEQIRATLQLPIVFLTAYGDEANLERIMATKPDGYLMKPFKNPDILSVVGIALEKFDQKTLPLTPSAESQPAIMKMQNSVFIKDDYAFVKLSLNEVLFVKSDNNYLEIHTSNKTHVVRSTLKDFGVILPPHKFVQVHRSYIINVDKVDRILANQVDIGIHEIAISTKYKDHLMQRIVLMK